MNGSVYVGKTGASPNYEAVLNVTSNSAQQFLEINQHCQCKFSNEKSDGNVTVVGDGKTANALLISGGSSVGC